MTADHDYRDGPIGDRDLVEEAARLLLTVTPTGWTHLHAAVQPVAQPPVAVATAMLPDGQAAPVAVPVPAVDVLAQHQRRAAAAGVPWRQLVLECHSDGRLSARTDAAVPVAALRRLRWLTWLLAAITVLCLGAAAVVFAVGWRWGPPPRVGMIAVPPPPARQQEALQAVRAWYDAENRSDAPAMRAMVCAHPSENVLGWITTIEDFGEYQSLVFPDAVTGFRDEGSQIWVKTASRMRPLNEEQRQAVEKAQLSGGFFNDEFTLAVEDGQLKICDTKD